MVNTANLTYFKNKYKVILANKGEIYLIQTFSKKLRLVSSLPLIIFKMTRFNLTKLKMSHFKA